MSMQLPIGIYRHYKGKEYEVLGVARHSETLEWMIVYKALYKSEDFGNNALWVRPLAMFLETVETESSIVKRFELVKQNG